MAPENVSAAGGYGPPGGYGGGPPGYSGGGGGGYGPPPGGGGPPGYGGGPPGYGGPPPGGFGGPPPGGFGGQPPGGFNGPPMGPMMGPEPSNGLAIGALVCGILSIPGGCCCSFLSVPLAVAAIVMGIIAMNKAKTSPMTHGGKNMAIGGIACGGVGVIAAILAIALSMGNMLMQQVNAIGH